MVTFSSSDAGVRLHSGAHFSMLTAEDLDTRTRGEKTCLVGHVASDPAHLNSTCSSCSGVVTAGDSSSDHRAIARR